MKLKEFNEIVESVKVGQEAIFKRAEELYKENVYDLKAYEEIGAYPCKRWSDQKGFLEKTVVKSGNIDGKELNTLYEVLQNFEREYVDVKEIGKSSISPFDNVGDCYIEEIGFKFYYFKINKAYLQYEIGRITREKIKDLLKPDSAKEAIVPDCKMVQLFRDSAIDWDTLQKITYKDCEL